MKGKPVLYKCLVVGVIVLFIGVGIQPAIANNDDATPPVSIHENYFFNRLITLDEYHDVGIKSIISPSNPFNKFKSFSPTNPEVYIQPGTEDIDVIVENNGTFPEYDLTCYVEIYEYITDPENGTLVYEDEITDIDLEEPNGGTKLLNFNDFTFADEGLYSIFIDLPLEIDDFPENNQRELIIAVDDTGPESEFPPIIDPPEPNGWNGWYVTCVNITFNATDEESGVKEIRYTVSGGAEGVIPGGNGTIMLCEDGDDILIEYWAVDNVGNVESPKNILKINIDRTPPEVSLTYEIIGGNWWQGWEFEFAITATDAMSGICLVEWFINDELIWTDDGPGPVYVWTIRYWPIPGAIFKVIVYDCAGNNATETINGSDIKTCFRSSFQNLYSQDVWHLWFFGRFPLLEVIISRILGL
jgi:hypothetical protein